MSNDEKSVYSATWDSYVTENFERIKTRPARRPEDLHAWQVLNTTDEAYIWPGDEWGDDAAVAHILDTCIAPHLDPASGAPNLVEIASGAGRFTDVMLERHPRAQIDCFDISDAFLQQMRTRFADHIADGQMRTHLLTPDARFMYQTLAEAGRARTIDCLFSFDAMVHVELHSIMIYLATAAAVLKPGGLVAMNVADASNPLGLQKLAFNAPGVFRQGGKAGMHFQFMSPDIANAMLTKLGFGEVAYHNCNGRDLFFSARLTDVDVARDIFQEAGSRWWVTK